MQQDCIRRAASSIKCVEDCNSWIPILCCNQWNSSKHSQNPSKVFAIFYLHDPAWISSRGTHVKSRWKCTKVLWCFMVFVIIHPSVNYIQLYKVFLAFSCPTDAIMPVCQGGQWEYVIVLLYLLGLRLTKSLWSRSLTFHGLPVAWPPVQLCKVKSSCVLAPCLWTQPSVLTTRQASKSWWQSSEVHRIFFRQDSGSEPCTCPSLKFS